MHKICHERFSSETDKEASSKYYMYVVEQIVTLVVEVATLPATVEQEISHSQFQRVTSAVRPEDSVSHPGSCRSFNSHRSTCNWARTEAAAKQAGLQAKAATLKKLHELEVQELQIRQKQMELKVQSEIMAFEAERKVYESVESEKALELNRKLSFQLLGKQRSQ